MAGGQGAQGTQGGQTAVGGQTKFPAINPQSVTDMQNLLTYYQQNKGGTSAMTPTGYADGGYVQNPPPVQNTGGPDVTGNAQGGGFAFDGSGSDAGVGGQPVNQVQSPYQLNQTALSGNQPPMLSQFRPQQGLQIQGNPTAQPFMPRRPR